MVVYDSCVVQAGIAWSDIPLAMTISRPYAIALLPTYIEVRANQRDSNHALAQVRQPQSLIVCIHAAGGC